MALDNKPRVWTGRARAVGVAAGDGLPPYEYEVEKERMASYSISVPVAWLFLHRVDMSYSGPNPGCVTSVSEEEYRYPVGCVGEWTLWSYH